MRLKTLLLGTAAAFAVAGGAQAADLAVADPVDYVKVCDVFGTGFFYIPGTDTCLKIGGYAKLEARWWDTAQYLNYADNDDGHDTYLSHWRFKGEVSVQPTAQTLSDLGLVTVFADIRAQTDDASYNGMNKLAYADSFYGQVGWFKFGRYAYVYDEGGPFNDDGSFRHDSNANQISAAWNWGGLGIWVGVADPRSNKGGSASYTGDAPDVTGKIGGSWGAWSAYLSGGYSDTIYGGGYGGQGVVTVAFGPLTIRGAGAVANAAGAAWAVGNAPDGSGVPHAGDGTVWSTYITGKLQATDMFSINGTFAYSGAENGAGDMWNAAAGVGIALTKNVSSVIEWQHYDHRDSTHSDQVMAYIKASY
jgi:hypothetical protein